MIPLIGILPGLACCCLPASLLFPWSANVANGSHHNVSDIRYISGKSPRPEKAGKQTFRFHDSTPTSGTLRTNVTPDVQHQNHRFIQIPPISGKLQILSKSLLNAVNKKSHLLEVAEEDLEDARAFESSDPEKSLKFMISRHRALAAYYLANEDDMYLNHLCDAIELKLKYVQECSRDIYPTEQIDYTLLSLAVCNIKRAKEFLALDTNYKNSHRFDIKLNCKLRELLEIPLLIATPKYVPTKSEVGLFQAIDNLISGSDVDWTLLRNYWSATKSKRYHRTLFEDVDLFSKALKYVQQSI